jgi:gamma-glutamyltranspeptidase/glutathione hydrolase
MHFLPKAASRRRIVALLLLCLTAAAWGSDAPVSPAQPEPATGVSANRIAFGARDMVAAAHPLAVDAGVRALARGGSAVDAAIAVQMVLTLVEPQSSGIGGGAFLLHYHHADAALRAYDGRETAPAAATDDQFLDADRRPRGFLAAIDGGLSVGTPGLLRMLEAAHRRHGRLPWSTLFDDAIRLCEDGFAVSPRLHLSIAAARARIVRQPAAARYFLDADGHALPIGTVLRNPALAATLRRVARDGADAFYSGPIARAIVDAVRDHPSNPGRLTLEDLAGYRPRERVPVCGDYRGLRICGMPPPSSGGVAVLQTLGILERFGAHALAPDSADAIHVTTEAYRLAFADRARYLADDDFVPVPVTGLLDPAYLAARAATIGTERSLGTAPPGTPLGAIAFGDDASAALPSTSHLSIVDRDGNAVAMTTTIENGFGSLQMVGGFLLNNQLTDFSFLPTDDRGLPVANRIEPGKRPRSSMAPTMVFGPDGALDAVIGSPGGANIIQYVTGTLIGLIDRGLDIQQAIGLPHFGTQNGPVTWLERGTALAAHAPELRKRGHRVVIIDLNSGLHGIVYNGTRANGRPGVFARHPGRGDWAAGADPRREGTARGSD